MAEPFKNSFDEAAAKDIAKRIHAVYPAFKRRSFVRAATSNLEALEMMGRVGAFAAALKDNLPSDVPEALGILVASLPPAFPETREGEREEGTISFALWPYGEFVRLYATDHFDEAMNAMVELTQRFTSEFAVRPFVRDQPDEVFARLEALTTHPSEHVRRWCSEGVRPRLPWGEKLRSLCEDPSPILPILEALKDDESLYVRRSVANTLGDIAKDNPQLALKIARRWNKGATPEGKWVVRHALRTLVKAGDAGALALHGFRPPDKLDVSLRASPKKVPIGSDVTIAVELHNRSKKKAKLLVDYRIHYVKSKGTRPKVFKWKELTLPAGASITLEKKRAMKVTSIRPLYPGRHRVDVQINGVVFGEAAFMLRDAASSASR